MIWAYFVFRTMTGLNDRAKIKVLLEGFTSDRTSNFNKFYSRFGIHDFSNEYFKSS